MEYKSYQQFDMSFFNDLLGVDINKVTKQGKYVKARQCVWVFLMSINNRFNPFNYTQIAKIFNVSRQNVMKGCDSFEKELRDSEDNYAKRYWEILKPHLETYGNDWT